jgi:hypothetical protein
VLDDIFEGTQCAGKKVEFTVQESTAIARTHGHAERETIAA